MEKEEIILKERERIKQLIDSRIEREIFMERLTQVCKLRRVKNTLLFLIDNPNYKRKT